MEGVAAELVKNEGERSLGVHVRASDEFRREKGAPLLQVYFRLIDSISRERPIERILVATDNRSVLDAFSRRYSQVVSQKKWYPAPGLAMHFNPGCPDPLAMARQAATDLAMLARCEVLLTLPHFSFGVIARIMSHARNDDKYWVNADGRGCSQNFRVVAEEVSAGKVSFRLKAV